MVYFQAKQTGRNKQRHGVKNVMAGNFGFIHEQIEIKVLILFIMRRLPEPVSIDTLLELTMCDEGVSYFDVTECIAKLVKTKHLLYSENKYSLTKKGEINGETQEKNLPYSVRAKAEDAAALARAAFNRNTMIKTHRNVDDYGGYKVTLSLSDGVGEIISMELFAANERQAKTFERGFRKNAEKVYHNVIEMIVGK